MAGPLGDPHILGGGGVVALYAHDITPITKITIILLNMPAKQSYIYIYNVNLSRKKTLKFSRSQMKDLYLTVFDYM